MSGDELVKAQIEEDGSVAWLRLLGRSQALTNLPEKDLRRTQMAFMCGYFNGHAHGLKLAMREGWR